MKIIIDNYGMKNPEENFNSIHTTFSALKFNSYKRKYGFQLHINRAAEKLEIKIKDLTTNKMESFSPYWTFKELEEIISRKCDYICYVVAKTRKEKEIEFFTFVSAQILSGFDFEKFLFFIESGKIVFDIRCGSYKTGANTGKPHDHGSGFRISKKHMLEAFDSIMEL